MNHLMDSLWDVFPVDGFLWLAYWMISTGNWSQVMEFDSCKDKY